jgi:hypothetical protein
MEYSNWPTYPQLYVAGELIGGCDIVNEMQQSGELLQPLQEKAQCAATAARAIAEAAAAGGLCNCSAGAGGFLVLVTSAAA